MIIFKNLNPIEVNEGDGQIILEIDPTASNITQETAVQISTIDKSAISTSFNEDTPGVDFSKIANFSHIINPDIPNTLTFAIDITDDAIAESDEQFQFRIDATEDESLNGVATVIIKDNDSTEVPNLVVDQILPEISINDLQLAEGDAGNTNFDFTVSLSKASDELITVDYSTANGTGESEDIVAVGTDSNLDPADYLPTSGTIEFEPGETEQTIIVEVITDTEHILEEAPDETFLLNLSNATNATLGNFVAQGTIVDDDLNNSNSNSTLGILQLDTQTFIEGNSGDNSSQELIVNLVNADGESLTASQNLTFTYRTADVSAGADLDYEFIEAGAAVITQGQASVSIPLAIIPDDAIELDETFSFILSDLNPDLAQFTDGQSELTTEITIQNDDGVPDNNTINSSDIIGSTVFRFFDSSTGVHFYTASETERDFINNNLDNYELEGESYTTVNPNNSEDAAAIYRFFNPVTGEHLYTANEAERDSIINNLANFEFEDVAFYAFETNVENTIPVYRFYEPTIGVHFYTANETERTFVTENLSNYSFEGIAYYALPAETSEF